MRIQPREQRGSCRTAASGIVEVSKPQPVCSQPIKIGSLDFAAVAANVRVPHVISHDDNNVWTRARLGGE